MTAVAVVTDVLLEIEAMAQALDALDRTARRGPTPYANPEIAAEIAVRRRRLLFELEAAGLLAPSDPGMRARLISSGLATLIGYHDAARAMRRYLASPARAHVIGASPPGGLLDAAISLDLFRAPTSYVAEGDSPEEWLARCEAASRASPPSRPPDGSSRRSRASCTSCGTAWRRAPPRSSGARSATGTPSSTRQPLLPSRS